MSSIDTELRLPEPPEENIGNKTQTEHATFAGGDFDSRFIRDVPPPPNGNMAVEDTEEPLLSKINSGWKATWNSFTEKQRLAAASIGTVVFTVAVLSVAGLDESSSNEGVEGNNPDFDSGGEVVPGIVDHLNESGQELDTEAETPEELREPDIGYEHEDGVVVETITESDGTETVMRYESPWEKSGTITHPDGTVEEIPFEESSDVPVIPLEHRAYEYFTGITYPEFIEQMKGVTPEVGSEPYDGQDVLDGLNQRLTYAFRNQDPRAIFLVVSPDNSGYSMAHQDIKELYAEYESMSEEERTEWDTITKESELTMVAYGRTSSGEVTELTTDFNVSMYEVWIANYTSTVNGEDSRHRQAELVIETTPIGGVYLEISNKQRGS